MTDKKTAKPTKKPESKKARLPKSAPEVIKGPPPGLPADWSADNPLSEKPSRHALVRRPETQLTHGSLELYLAEINKFPILTREEEEALAQHYWKTGDLEAAHKLVTANLRFVVKIALQYAKYGIKLKDLIQEGNVGLMMAVKKYNPNLKYRLISYAVWWIRAYIQKYLLDSWSMVRVGTTQAQRKLFNSLKRVQRTLQAIDGKEPSDKVLAEALQVNESEVRDMKQRLQGHDLSLDAPLGDDSTTTRLDLIASSADEADEQLIRKDDQEMMERALMQLRRDLNEKELAILDKRLLNEEPVTLQEIGDALKISRERVRQIEENVKKKLKKKIEESL